MGCMSSFSLLNCFSQATSASSSMIMDNKSTFFDDLEDTVPLASGKQKKSKHIIDDKQKNFSRIIPLLEKLDDTSTFRNVNDQLHLSNYNADNLLSSTSTASFEDELSDSIKNNEFINQILKVDDNISNKNPIQNAFPPKYDAKISEINNQENDTKSLINQTDILVSTEDEGGISGEMDSSCDDT